MMYEDYLRQYEMELTRQLRKNEKELTRLMSLYDPAWSSQRDFYDNMVDEAIKTRKTLMYAYKWIRKTEYGDQ